MAISAARRKRMADSRGRKPTSSPPCKRKSAELSAPDGTAPDWDMPDDKNKNVQGQRPRRVYGRRLGRPLRPERLDVLDTLLPRLEIKKEDLAAPGALTPARLFGAAPPATWFEIGFGNWV